MKSILVNTKPIINNGAVIISLFLIGPCLNFKKSAIVSLALLKAVSPEVTGQATTPRIARAQPILPSSVLEIMLTTQPCPPFAIICFPSSPVLPKNAIAAAAQINATIPSAIIAP